MRHSTDNNEPYYNHCWSCKTTITSGSSKRCPICGWYICPVCGECNYHCPHIKDGYDREGFDKNGYNREGFDKNGFDKNGFHKNGTKYDDEGFGINGYNKEGFDKRGKDADGYDQQGYDAKGFNRDKRHRNGTFFNDEGFNFDGLDKYDLECEKYHIGTKVIFKGIPGEITFYDPQITQPVIKIKLENNEEKHCGLKTLIKNGFITISEI